jgi:ATP-binding cassette subfamily E protein 1
MSLQAMIKPQYVDHIPRAVKGTVDAILSAKEKRGNKEHLLDELELRQVRDRGIDLLSGGELQRFAIAVVMVQESDMYVGLAWVRSRGYQVTFTISPSYMFDEPSSYLDVKQRLQAARTIRSLLADKDTAARQKYVIVVEHDLSVLDYLSDFICCLYGTPGIYGVVTMPFSVREGINVFLAGFVPTENLRFRDWSLSFKVTEAVERVDDKDRHRRYSWGDMTTVMGDFTLDVKAGQFTDSEIIVLLGQNGTGKTTLIRMLAGRLKPTRGEEVPELNISYKPQKISPSFKGTVRQLLHAKIQNSWMHPQFMTDVTKPMKIEPLLDQAVQNLSGGELQRVALVLCLGQPADVYLIDEPSAYLDSEQRIVASKVIKRFILHAKKTAFVVEHDFIMATYLADRVIVYDGTPSVHCIANAPQSLLTGMNKFLASLDITFRRDPTNFRPRINKSDSQQDREQKEAGAYFYLDE